MKMDASMGCSKGFTFRPGDDELIQYYLIPKVEQASSSDCDAGFITDADVYGLEPEDLVAQAGYDPDTGYLYFFADRRLKNSNGRAKRAKRTLTLDGGAKRGGTWKDRGKPTAVLDRDDVHQIGTRRTLSFIRNGETRPTAWRMHEYTLEIQGNNNGSSSLLGKRKGAGYLDTVLCRLFLVKEEKEKKSTKQTDLKEKEAQYTHHQYASHNQPQFAQSYSSYSNMGEASCFYQQYPPPQDQCNQYNIGESSCSYQQSPPENHHQQYNESQEEDQSQIAPNHPACSQQQDQMEVQPISLPQQQQDVLDALQSELSFTEMLEFPDFSEEYLGNGMYNEVLASYSQCLVQ